MNSSIENPAVKRVLIVTPSFPPSSSADSQRVRMSLPYYRENGWEPIVLCVAPEENDAPLEPELLATVPDDVPIYRCKAWSRKICGRVGLGNLGWRAFFPLSKLGSKILRENRVDLVFFSTTQFAVLPLGRWWRKRHGVPYVIDLQDPWRTDYYERSGVRKPPGGWKYQVARAQAALLEPWSFRKMSGLMTVSPRYIADLSRRYTWFSGVVTCALHFGASELDLSEARGLEDSSPQPQLGTVRLVFTGAAGPITPHAVEVLFEALQKFKKGDPESAQRIRLEFIGTSYAAASVARNTIVPLAESFGVSELVVEIPARVGHLRGLRIQADADALLLLGSTDLAYSPSKLHPYFLSRKPILAVVFKGSVLEKILRELNCAVVASCENEMDHASAIPIIVDFFRGALRGFSDFFLPQRNEEVFRAEYLARSLTAKQAAFFDAAIEQSHVHLR